MAEEEVTRRLAAIVAADVAGYSRLVSEDEEGTLAELRAIRSELTDSKISDFHGRIANTAGDSILIEFPSVVEALRCCMDIQRAMTDRNADVPKDRRIEFRIGINLGDVIEQDGDLLGAGVNVAARLEGLSEPGGICISRAARDQVRDLLDVTLEDMGEVEVKNIARPVRTFRVMQDGEAATAPKRFNIQKRPLVLVAALVATAFVGIGLWYWQPWIERVEPARAERMAYKLPDKPSIVVLPFVNMSGDPKREYLADGLTETIIGQLSKTPQLFVIARNSSFTYKNKPVEVRQVSEELGVRYVLEGSIRGTGEHIRVHAQLIDATTGYHIWSEKYDHNATDALAAQDDIALKIASTIDPANEGRISVAEQARVRRKGSQNLKAYDHLMRGLSYWWNFKKDTNLLFREEALKAIELDPKLARAYAFVAWSHMAERWFGWTETPEESVAQAFEWARKAIAIDEREYHGYWVLARAYMAKRQFDEAGRAFEKTFELNPNDAQVLNNYANKYLVSVGRAEDAIPLTRKAMRLNPHHPNRWHASLGVASYLLGSYHDAIASMELVTKPTIVHHTIVAGSYAQLGKQIKAREIVNEILQKRPDYSLEKFSQRKQFKNPKDAESWLEGPRKAGLPEKSPLKLPDKPSIAVLPFQNMSGDPAQAYFADGITEDIITDLSKLSGLFVIARNSSFQYRGDSLDVKKVGRELGVRYVLEGSVRRSGDQVRINVQLIDAATSGHLWADRYDGVMKDVFGLQDKVTQKVVAALATTLKPGVQLKGVEPETDSAEAYDAFLRGWSHYRRDTPDNYAKAIPYFEKAIELDPDYSRAYAALAVLYWSLIEKYETTSEIGWWTRLGIIPTDAALRTQQYLKEAMKDPSPLAHRVASGKLAHQGQYDAAVGEARRAIALDPNDPVANEAMSTALIYAGKPAEAVEWINQAMRLDPQLAHEYFFWLGLAQFGMERYEDAAKTLTNAARSKPDDDRSLIILAATYGHLGRVPEAKSAVDKANGLRRERRKRLQGAGIRLGVDMLLPGPYTQKDVDLWPFKEEADRTRLRNGLRLAGLPKAGKGKQVSPTKISGATTVDPVAAKLLFDRGVPFIDVRTGPRWKDSRIPGAVNLDLKKKGFNEAALSQVIAKDQEVVIYCMGPRCLLSSKACVKAVGWGYEKVYYLRDGFPGWKAAGYPVEVAQ